MFVLAACGGGRDVIPETKDVRESTPADGRAAASNGGYEFVARRPLGSVGLAEARGLSSDVAEQATNAVADTMQRCMTELLRTGQMVQGAARVVARVTNDGGLEGLNMTLSPGSAVTHNAILCVIAPIKSLTFPPTAEKTARRGIALEAAWSPPQ
jgi:hypothetical protein